MEPAVIILGDHNARTGKLLDTNIQIAQSSFKLEMLTTGNETLELPSRLSCDKEVNQNGRYLIEFCKESGFKIANGRIKGINDGLTYVGNMGGSTIDYALANEEAWFMLDRMDIHSRVDSDHLPISISPSEE